MFSVIVLAGGLGLRMRRDVPKQFLTLSGKPLIIHTLERLEKIEDFSEIVIVCHPDYRELLFKNIDAYALKKKYIITDSGDTRQQSVYKGLMAASGESVVIHESARPIVTTEEFLRLIKDECQNITYGPDIPFTVSIQKDGFIGGVLERNRLINIQLPQKFQKKLLIEAHNKAIADNNFFTDDSSIIYYYYQDCKIKVLPGTHYNVKLTDPVDMVTGELIYKEYIVGSD